MKSKRDRAEILQMLKGGMSVEEAATELKISASRVYQILNHEGHSLLKQLKQHQDKLVAQEYQEALPSGKPKYTMLELLERHGISRATLYAILRRTHTPRNRRRTPSKPTSKETQSIIESYQNDVPVQDIALNHKRAVTYIYKVLHENDVPLRKPRK